VAEQSTLSGPSGLRRAPQRATTPLPASFVLHVDPSTRSFDEGTVVLGGTPLRVMRLSARARDLVARWSDGAPVGATRGAGLLGRRLVSAGAFAPRPATAQLSRRDVTVVVPVRDRPAQLERLLRTLRDLACVVVDDASDDASQTKHIAERYGARFVALARNSGPAPARNAGLACVRTPLVAFLDSDCVPRPDWLEPLLGHFDDPVVAAAAPRVVAAPGRPGVVARYEAARSSLDRGGREAPVRPGSPVSFVPSAAIVVRADIAAGPDLFDPGLRAGEDVDLVWRLVEAGWDVRYVPSARVEHDGPSRLAELLAKRAFYGTSAAPLARRHPGALAPAQMSGWSLVVWILVLLRRPALAATALSTSVLVLAHRLRGVVRDPVALALRIAGVGTVRSALPTLNGVTRAWAPLLAVGLCRRRTRLPSALALALPALADWAHQRDTMDPLRYGALHVADDVAYGIGVWAGCAHERTWEPLVPRVSWRSRSWSSSALRQEDAPRAQADVT
jgi:mycofactocin glycosyltransferase